MYLIARQQIYVFEKKKKKKANIYMWSKVQLKKNPM